MSLAIVLSGLFFSFLIITNLASNVFGYKTHKNISEIEFNNCNKGLTQLDLQKISQIITLKILQYTELDCDRI